VKELPRYLLDVSALIALGVRQHQFHLRVARWVEARQFSFLTTCSITELGFVRVLAQTPDYRINVEEACGSLSRLKEGLGEAIVFIKDDHDVSHLPAWVKTGSQTTDGHLLNLAKTHGAMLATLDAKIPGAFLIP
jgi:predicted nucleic acid-binding protein